MHPGAHKLGGRHPKDTDTTKIACCDWWINASMDSLDCKTVVVIALSKAELERVKRTNVNRRFDNLLPQLDATRKND
jgi:hypothetical protein